MSGAEARGCLSSYILLFGAELNSEIEHQTAQDTTNRSALLGERSAWVADHVASDAPTGEPAATTGIPE